MNDQILERDGSKPTARARARLEALIKANAAPRCGARSKRTGKPCRGAAMPNGRCKLHGGKSTGPRTPEGLERSRRANWKHGHFSLVITPSLADYYIVQEPTTKRCGIRPRASFEKQRCEFALPFIR
jgi:hypothetical protein